MALVSLITNWLEYVQSQVPEANARSYADDLSVCAQHTRSRSVKQRLRQVHEHTDRFVQLSGMVWHRDKSFIFGPREVQSAVPAIKNYCTNFRPVGGSVELGGREAWTPSEPVLLGPLSGLVLHPLLIMSVHTCVPFFVALCRPGAALCLLAMSNQQLVRAA